MSADKTAMVFSNTASINITGKELDLPQSVGAQLVSFAEGYSELTLEYQGVPQEQISRGDVCSLFLSLLRENGSSQNIRSAGLVSIMDHRFTTEVVPFRFRTVFRGKFNWEKTS